MIAERLLKAILQAAIQGKLTEQLPEDGDARDLLKEIEKKKKGLIKEGKLKKDKPLPEIAEDEKPFDIPENWCWVRLGEACTITNGFTPSRSNSEFWKTRDVPWFTVEDIRDQGHIITSTKQYISQIAVGNGNRVVSSKSVLLCCTASIGEYAYTEIDLTTNQQFNGITVNDLFKGLLYSKYIYYYVQTISGELAKQAGITTFPFLSTKKLTNFSLPLPPFSEQKRIVEQIEKLLAEIDILKTDETKLEELQKSFPKKMKDAILRYAIQGKLTEQLHEDGDAKDLLEEIKKEKEQLIREGKIKKDKSLPEITDEEKPFDIPDNWVWVRLSEIAEPCEYPFADGPFGSNLKTEHYTEHPEVRIIQLSNIGEKGWKDRNTKYTTFEHLETIGRSEVQPGDIVIAKMMPAGRAIEVPNFDKKYVLSSDAMKYVPNRKIDKSYILYAINSEVFRSQIYAEVHGITRIRTSLGKVRGYLIPLPPLSCYSQFKQTAKS